MEIEVWKDVAGYEGLYKVSSLGRIKSRHRRTTDRHNQGVQERFISPQKNSNGYFHLFLCKDGKNKIHTLHRLLATSFLPNPDNLPEINHINGIKSDFRLQNLEWISRSGNRLHAIRTGLLKPAYGDRKARARFTNDQARMVKQMLTTMDAKQILSELQMDSTDMRLRNAISQIKRGARYSKV